VLSISLLRVVGVVLVLIQRQAGQAGAALADLELAPALR
jgi:hypothetical protein